MISAAGWFFIIFLSVLVGALILYAVMRTPGRARNPEYLIDINPNTKIAIITEINKKIGIRVTGTGGEVYPKGMGKRPISLNPGYQEISVNNMVFLYSKEALDTINFEWYNKYQSLQKKNITMANERSQLSARNHYLESSMYDRELTNITKKMKQVTDAAPKLYIKTKGGQSGPGGM